MNIEDGGTTAIPIDELQIAVALRDRALAEAQLWADEQVAKTAMLRRLLAERDDALDRVEAAAREQATALARGLQNSWICCARKSLSCAELLIKRRGSPKWSNKPTCCRRG